MNGKAVLFHVLSIFLVLLLCCFVDGSIFQKQFKFIKVGRSFHGERISGQEFWDICNPEVEIIS